MWKPWTFRERFAKTKENQGRNVIGGAFRISIRDVIPNPFMVTNMFLVNNYMQAILFK